LKNNFTVKQIENGKFEADRRRPVTIKVDVCRLSKKAITIHYQKIT
jgi:hypothetical protein